MSVFDKNSAKRIPRRSFLKGLTAAAALPALGAIAPPRKPVAWKTLSSPDDDAAYWRMIRSCFVMEPGYSYLNNGTEGPSPLHVLEEMSRCAHDCAADPWVVGGIEESIYRDLTKVAGFIGAEADEVALMYNTTDGMNAVIQGLMLKAGDEVLISDQEHPSGVEPFRRRAKHDGIVIRKFATGTPPRDPAEILEAAEREITPRTRLLSFSHICYTTSLMMPVAELCALAASKGVLTLVDGAHPLGMINLNMKALGCDFYAASGQKWMLGPLGSGVLYVRKELLDRVDPVVVSGGWDNNENAGKFMARGSINVVAFKGFLAALRFQNGIGKEKIERRVRSLASRLRSGLAEIPGVEVYTSNDPRLSAGLTSVRVGDYNNGDVLAALNQHYGLFPRTIGHDLNAIRFSTHFYNTEEEVDRSITAIREIIRNGLPDLSAAEKKLSRERMSAIEAFCA